MSPRTQGGRAFLDRSEQRIVLLAIFSRVIPLVLLHLVRIPLFDSSPDLAGGSSPTLRWDAIHFLSIAVRGYEYEQHVAFQPGWMGIMRLAGEVVRICRFGSNITADDVIVGSWVVANAAFVGAALMLYRLTAALYDPVFAFVTTCFYLLPPTPAVLSSAYTEQMFALCTFAGYFWALKSRWISAALALAAAVSIRATGIFSTPLLAWMTLLPDGELSKISSISMRRVLHVAGLCFVIVAPFIGFQAYVYRAFCLDNDSSRSWCEAALPLPYSFVQGEYWGVGLFKYWTSAQIPNLIIAGPVLLVSVTGTLRFFNRSPRKHNLIPFHLHHLLMTALLIFASHTQIALRVVSGDPVLWWNVCAMAFDWSADAGGMTRGGRIWVWWVVIWGAISIPLWAGHYPPA